MSDFTQLEQKTGRTIYLDGKQYLFFGGTSYLGLATDAEYAELIVAGVKKYGLNNGTSRSNNIQQDIFSKAEAYAASRFGFEASLMVSSGYLAAQLAIKKLANVGELLYAPNCHPALWLDGDPMVTGHFSDWAKWAVDYINTSKSKNFVVISNSLDNLTPEAYDFAIFKQVIPEKKVVLLLDDSHGIGVVRPNAVAVDHLEVEKDNVEIIVVASMAKGLATDAGIVLGSSRRIQELKTSPFFFGASPSSPAFLYAFMEGESIYLERFESMQRNILVFREHMGDRLTAIDKFPVFTSENPGLFDYLEKNGFLISSFPYPLPKDPLLNRIVISAHHQEADLLKLAGLICKTPSDL